MLSLATRRLALKGAAALLALAAPPGMSLASPAAADHPDTALLALGREWEAARVADAAADARFCEAEAEGERRMPREPGAIFVRHGDRELGMPPAFRRHDGRHWYSHGTVDRLRTLQPGRAVARPVTPADNLPEGAHTYVAWVPVPEGRARAEEIVAAWDRWQGEVDVLKVRLELPALDAAQRETGHLRASFEERIATTPATTLEGLAVKARVALWMTGDRAMLDHERVVDADAVTLFGTSIMRDLLALAPSTPR